MLSIHLIKSNFCYFIAPKEQTHVASIAWFDQQFSKEIIKDKKDLVLRHDGMFHTLLGLFDVVTVTFSALIITMKSPVSV
jgi:glucan phosphoethanolaminetransferase (alkaline phosphatase superfamily)